MKRLVFYILFLPLLLFGSQEVKSLRVYNPALVRAGQPFEISVVSEFPGESDTLFFELSSTSNVSVSKILLRTFSSEIKLKFKKNFDDETGSTHFTCKIAKENLPEDESFKFQLVIKLKGIKKTTSFNLSTTYSNNNTPDFSVNSGGTRFSKNVIVNAYQTQKPAGKLIQFSPDSEFEILLSGTELVNRLLTEFWAKFDLPTNNFLIVKNAESDENIFGLSINKFQTLELNGGEEAVYFNNCFVSSGVWYHFTILSDKESGQTTVYVNDIKYCTFTNPKGQIPKSSAILFMNKNESGKFYIDLLKIWDYGNEIQNSFRGKHFLHYAADSSRVLLDLNFDRELSEINLADEYAKISFGGIKIKRSDAPVFSTVPDLNVALTESYNSIEWKETEYSFAKTFILEKSVDGIEFTKIYEVEAENQPGKTYYFSDYKEDDSKIVFYRIKQLNVDGTISFSPTVKVGQAEHKDFMVDQNYPNPFNPVTTIKVNVLIPGEYKIVVYDLVGNTVALLHQGYLNDGLHSFEFNGSDLPSGIYFYEVAGRNSSNVYKMILAK